MPDKTENNLIRHYLDMYNLNDILSQEIIQNLSLFHFKAGNYLIRAHDPVEYLYFYVKGKSKVFILLENGKSLLVRFYEPFELVGDVEFVSFDNHICNMQAITDVLCIGIKTQILKKHIESNTKLLLFICKSLGEKMATFNMASAINQMYPLENRLASYLTAVSDLNQPLAGRIRELHTENMTELADLLGTSYRQLTRVIKQFKDQGILDRVGKKFKILDTKQIKNLSRDIYS